MKIDKSSPNEFERELPNLPRKLENKIVCVEDDKKVTYIGKLSSIHFGHRPDEGFIEAIPQLDRYDLIKVKKGLFKKKEVEKENWTWYVLGHWSTIPIIQFDGSISNYKESLFYRARYKGLDISPKLVEMVFDPMEAQLKGIYEQIVRWDKK